jgi:hypothetical protein
MMKTIAALLACALLLLSGCGKSQQEIAAEKAKAAAAVRAHQRALALATAKKQAAAEYAACRTAMLPIINALDNVQGAVNVGVTFANYGPLVGSAESALLKLPKGSVETHCYNVVLKPLGQAIIAYANAASIWNGCIQNGASCDGQLQRPWNRASANLTGASDALEAMKPVQP